LYLLDFKVSVFFYLLKELGFREQETF
jgi:hypothetical protein